MTAANATAAAATGEDVDKQRATEDERRDEEDKSQSRWVILATRVGGGGMARGRGLLTD